MEYPQYRSHKIVGAVKVSHVEKSSDGSLLVHLERGFDSLVVPHAEHNHKPHPEAGWYAIRYPDEYLSFSPAEAFEEVHTPFMGWESTPEDVGDAEDGHGEKVPDAKVTQPEDEVVDDSVTS